ncbi:THAP domain-containing protein 9 [Elysia marginata]|uniref:THAP domain-containing protein 9 n=1 Tax=Elysia marginata TaxID=1093978 RepID=A0AAV4HQ37_9GAST|nr:THAP domain-containing protein 9 [Elysia marginata]
MKQWITCISRQTLDGKPWQPTQYDKVCSEHFLPSDVTTGVGYKTLISTAVTSVFPACTPVTNNALVTKRVCLWTKKRSSATISDCFVDTEDVHQSKCAKTDHAYCCPSVREDLSRTKQKLSDTREKLADKAKQVKSLSAKVKRRDHHISSLLDEVRHLRLLQEEEVNLLRENFSEETLTLIGNKVKAGGKSKHSHQYTDELKTFAVTLHYYSAAAYEFLRKYLCLPHANSIRRWASSHNVQRGFLDSVICFLKEKLETDPDIKDVTVMFDAMSIRKELIYDQKQQVYAGYINHGHLQTAAADTLASEVLVFLAFGLKRILNTPLLIFQ